MTAAPLTITANSTNKVYGAAVPTLTASYSGFKNSDSLATSTTGSPSLATTAITTSPVGSYSISATQGTLAGSNYTFNFVNGTLTVGQAILVEAALAFLGLGIQPPTPALGALVFEGQDNPQAWWLTVFPGLTIVVVVLCVNFMGDGLRDALDPTQRRVRA